jgi:hypothetical protein
MFKVITTLWSIYMQAIMWHYHWCSHELVITGIEKILFFYTYGGIISYRHGDFPNFKVTMAKFNAVLICTSGNYAQNGLLN